MRDKQANRRIRLLLAIFAIVFAACLGRAVWLQGVRAASLGRQASLQHHESITIPAGRGTIFDTNGVQLAIGEQTTTVYADPRQVTNARAVAMAAHDILGVDGNDLYAALLSKKTSFVYVRRFADPKLAARFLNKKFNGVNGYPEEKRAYPQGNVASQVIGFAGTDDKGLAGLEIKYDRELTGKPGKQVIVRDPFGHAIDVVSSTSERQGRDIFTTIDNKIQANAQQVLRDTVAKYHAKSATAIVLDPHTGAVLAMAQAPGYDANNASHTPQAVQTNHAVTDVFEPGSVFKLVTVSGALSEGLVTPQTTFGLPSCIQIADKCIHDAEPRGYETMSVAQILSRSSNVGAVTIAKKLGAPDLMKWIYKFGFGKTTGLDFPGESGGIVPTYPDQWSGTTIGNVPIGQGIAVTPIQIAAAYGAIANNGVWVEPHLVQRIGGRTLTGWKHRRIVTPAVNDVLKQMLTGVVDEHGATGNEAQIPGYTVAGKTGTAQIPGPHGYTTGKYVASFVGMVPVKTPRLLVLVSVDQPQSSIFGGVVAAPAFAQIAKFDLQYMAVPPDAPVKQ
ncbi:MAG TPA: penicillin-binding protein 2 [Gaiellaceae bacterium]|jgi:cell division protein FtsI/penicillin-binding protein 2|nr:penicillin-binding protein 2 [Gaiellaceae bacterium]